MRESKDVCVFSFLWSKKSHEKKNIINYRLPVGSVYNKEETAAKFEHSLTKH